MMNRVLEPDVETLLRGPLFFEKNRVGRVYTGGALFADFFGDDSVDGFEPEEWVASSVAAINKVSKGPKEGVSRVRGTNLYFDDLLKAYPRQMLGDREAFGVLTKVLDSAIRLPIQAHPDKAFSRKYFRSEYGKAESWVVLATRPGACLYFGFRDKLTKAEFAAAVARSESDKSAMEPLLNVISVKPGDVYLVPARMVHAIGSGCLILEIQEPTDFTIQPEYWCGDYLLNEREMYIGLEPDVALDVFDFSVWGEAAVEMGRRTPRVTKDEGGVKWEELITYRDTPCFAVKRLTLSAAHEALSQAPAVYVATQGAGEIICGGKTQPIRKGDYFFLPFAAEKATVSARENLQIVACLPPERG